LDWNNSNILPLLHFNLWFIPIIYKLKKQIGIMAKGPFKMKGSPMQRNFGVSPVKQDKGFKKLPKSEKKNLDVDQGFKTKEEFFRQISNKSNTEGFKYLPKKRGNANATFVKEKIQ